MEESRFNHYGVAMIVSGPSGAGKSTVCSRLREFKPDLHFSVSCTTRAPREAETDGIDYHFLDKDDFRRKIRDGKFIEYAEVHGNLYGTLITEIVDKVSAGIDVLLDIDVQGAVNIKKRAEEDALLAKTVETVFITPPTFDELEQRLRNRGTESEETILLRLRNARKELEYLKEYEYLIINDDIETAVGDMIKFFDVMHTSTKRLNDTGFLK